MGKISAKDTDALIKSGVLSKKALAEMENKNLVAKNKPSIKRFMKTADGKLIDFKEAKLRITQGQQPEQQPQEPKQ